MARTEKVTRWAKFKKPLIITVATLLVYSALGFLLIPALIESQLPKIIFDQTERHSSLAKAEFNPFLLTLRLQGFEIEDADSENFVAFEELFADLEAISLFKWVYHLDEVRLTKPQLRIAVLSEGEFNFSSLLSESATEVDAPVENKSAIPPIRIRYLHIDDGRIDFEDLSHPTPYKTEFSPLNFGLNNVSTVPNEDSTYRFSSVIDGTGEIHWEGDITVEPLRSHGKLKLTAVHLPRLWEYIKDIVKFEIQQGDLHVEANYEFDGIGENPQLLISEGQLKLDGFQLMEKGQNAPLIDIPQFDIDGVSVDLQQQRVMVQSVQSTRASFDLKKDKNGVLNFVPLFEIGHFSAVEDAVLEEITKPHETTTDVAESKAIAADGEVLPPTVETPQSEHNNVASIPDDAIVHQSTREPEPSADTPWLLEIRKLSLQQYKLRFEDRVPEQGVVVELAPLNLMVNNISSAPGNELTLKLDSGMNQTGRIDVNGTLTLDPLLTSMDLDVHQIDLGLFYPYVTTQLENLQGALQFDGQLGFHFDENDKPKLQYYGSFGLVNFRTAKENLKLATDALNIQGKLDFSQDANAQPSVNFDGSIGLDNLKAQFEANALASRQIRLKGKLAFYNDAKQNPVVRHDGSVMALGLSTGVDDYTLRSGGIRFDGRTDFHGDPAKKPMLRYRGEARVYEFAAIELATGYELLKWKTLSLRGLAFDYEPTKLSLSDVLIDRPYAKIVIDPDTSESELEAVSEVQSANPPPEIAQIDETRISKAEKSVIPITIGKVTIKDGSANFADRSLMLNFATGIHELNGVISGLSSKKDGRASVLIEGQVDNYAPVKIEGEINPLSSEAYTDIAVLFDSISLTTFTPYAGHFAGYKIEKGKMSLDLHYKLDNRRLKAENKILLEQLTLGKRVESPNATSLPVGLAIALMKDTDGNIDLDLPIAGTLDDPEFSVMGLVGKALFNLLTKAITSPFSLLAGLAGDNETLDEVAFDFGETQLNKTQIKKLTNLSDALQQRPSLQLEIKGVADPVADRLALAEQIVLKRLREEVGDDPPVVGHRIPLDNEDYREELEDLYDDEIEDLPGMAPIDPELEKTNPRQWIQVILKRTLENQTIEDLQLSILARERAKSIRDYLIQQGGVAPERIFLLDVDLSPSVSGEYVVSNLSLASN